MEERNAALMLNPVLKQDKKKYILGTDESAAALFIELCTKRVYVEGFIDSWNAEILFFHKPVYDINDVDLNGNGVVISKKDVYILNPELYEKKVLLYGTDAMCKKAITLLQSYGIDVIGSIHEIKNGRVVSDDAVLLAVGHGLSDTAGVMDNVYRGLQKFHIDEMPFESRQIWIDRENGLAITPGGIAQLAEYMEHEHIHEIILYGNNLPIARKCAEVYRCLNFVSVLCMADATENEEQNVSAIENIIYREDYLVLVYEKICGKFFDKLYSLGVEKRRCGKVYPYSSPNFNEQNSLLDIHLGYTYEMNSSYPGIYIYGENHRDDFKIAVLGGSTSDSRLDLRIRSWVEIMYNQYCHEDITIFNGAVSGYYSGQELVKLKRDMLKLNPDMIVVYDGYNDLMQDILHKKNQYLKDLVNFAGQYLEEADGRRLQKTKAWEGVPSDQDPVENWLENMECMHAIAENRNIKFLAFMQPMLFTKKNLDQHSKTIQKTMLFHGENIKFMHAACQFRQLAKKIEGMHSYIHDLSSIFDNEDVYMDMVHVYEKGNEIIAEHIWDVIKDKIKKGGK